MVGAFKIHGSEINDQCRVKCLKIYISIGDEIKDFLT